MTYLSSCVEASASERDDEATSLLEVDAVRCRCDSEITGIVCEWQSHCGSSVNTLE